MPEFKGQALDALGRAYAMKKSYSEAAESWEQKLISSKSALEKAYLFHEIGRCYFGTIIKLLHCKLLVGLLCYSSFLFYRNE